MLDSVHLTTADVYLERQDLAENYYNKTSK